LKNNLFKNGRDRKAGGGRKISGNIEEWIEEAHDGLIMVEEKINEIGRVERSKKQNKDGVKSRKARDWIRNVGRGRGMSRDVEGMGNA
jgi:hypothetical protein